MSTFTNASVEGFEKLKKQLWEFMFSDIYPNEQRRVRTVWQYVTL